MKLVKHLFPFPKHTLPELTATHHIVLWPPLDIHHLYGPLYYLDNDLRSSKKHPDPPHRTAPLRSYRQRISHCRGRHSLRPFCTSSHTTSHDAIYNRTHDRSCTWPSSSGIHQPICRLEVDVLCDVDMGKYIFGHTFPTLAFSLALQ